MSSQEATAAAYDSVPYDTRPLRPGHPHNLAVLAHLAGLTPPRTERCRILEIGCATGGNLLPMAESLPGARMVGIDLSPAQIATGRRAVEELGLHNIELHAASVTDVDFAPDSFDYVICHGVYSWVPAAVQSAILATCGRVLTPSGIAYVSYNTYPGWHMRRMVREMLLYRVRHIEDPVAQVRAARDSLAFLCAHVRDRDSAYARYLAEEARRLLAASDSYVFHEYLEADNRPVYFHEFVGAARAHGLDVFGDAAPEDRYDCGPEIAAELDRWTDDAIDREQHLDFLRQRTFRRSLLCRASAPRVPGDAARLTSLWLGSPVRPEREAVDLEGGGTESFHGFGGLRLTVQDPWLKTAFALLGQQWPEVVPFAALADEVARRRGSEPGDEAKREILEALAQCHIGGVLKLEPGPVAATRTPGERPRASLLSRSMARTSLRVATLRHELVELREVDRQVLLLLDGTQDTTALADGLQRVAGAAGLSLPHGAAAAVTESLGVLRMSSLLLPAQAGPAPTGAPPVR